MSTQKNRKVFLKNVVVLRYVNMENRKDLVKNVEEEIRSRGYIWFPFRNPNKIDIPIFSEKSLKKNL